ncbi:MAG: DUF4282 domain-containing protein [Gammaproteobacteria bacterium]|mgnify:CR=1 FL=1|jgi:hypothetical protein|nr:DUF4282 domain-containing protein [Gammaproteobacteria bacterium]MBQ0773872.1 DUF4282 domain-containing protein [Gammaproteobacteria bacterium]|tara:strand:+ start:35399 stop:35974 length:576 start_codon:yes stop_codon:yes gene_type:complete
MVNPEETETAKEAREQEHGLTRFQEKFRRGLFWCLEYWRELFNFRFDKYMIIQMLPGVYGMLLGALVLTIIFWCGIAFMKNFWLGLGATFFAAPIAFLVCASLLRALLEFYLVIFKMAEHVDELVGLRDTVDRLSGISDTVDEMVAVTRRIPFWKAITGKPSAASRRKVPENRRRRTSDRADTQDDTNNET